MLGASALSEYALSDQSILLAGVSEMSGIASSANAGVGIMSGISSMNSTATQTSTGIYISAGANSEVNFNFNESSIGTRIQTSSPDIESAFTKTSNAIMIGSGVITKDLNFNQDTFGELLFEDVNAGVTPENYVTITPSGTESWTTVNPSGSETWIEIEVE
jgi:hypothetical protein